MPSNDHISIGGVASTANQSSIRTLHPNLTQAIASVSVAQDQVRLEHSSNMFGGSYPIMDTAGKCCLVLGKTVHLVDSVILSGVFCLLVCMCESVQTLSIFTNETSFSRSRSTGETSGTTLHGTATNQSTRTHAYLYEVSE